MPSRKKPPPDPRLVRQQERKEKALAAFERAYARMRRNVSAMEKARRVIVSAQKNIARVLSEIGGEV